MTFKGKQPGTNWLGERAQKPGQRGDAESVNVEILTLWQKGSDRRANNMRQEQTKAEHERTELPDWTSFEVWDLKEVETVKVFLFVHEKARKLTRQIYTAQHQRVKATVCNFKMTLTAQTGKPNPTQTSLQNSALTSPWAPALTLASGSNLSQPKLPKSGLLTVTALVQEAGHHG